jgi:uncharacterized protein DUF3800
MLKVFCDECNRHKSDVHFIFAGWTAKANDWETFSDAWNECLTDKPKIGYFKTYEADSLQDEFRFMNRSQAELKKLSLARVICRFRKCVSGYVTTVPHEYLLRKPQRVKKLVGTRVYDWGFISIVSTILEHSLYLRESETIDFVFDKCSELQSNINEYEARGRSCFPPALRKIAGTIIPGDDKLLCGLQAADLLCGQQSVYMRTGCKPEPLAELETAKVPVLVMPASPPRQMADVLRYAEGVVKREDMVREMLKYLKAQGIKLNDIKE